MTYHGDPPGNNVASSAHSPGPYPPSFGNQPPLNHLPPNQSRNHAGRRGLSVGTVVLLVILTLVSAGIGAAVGTALTRRTQPADAAAPAVPHEATPSSDEVTAANIQLCSSFAIINSARPNPATNADALLPQIFGLTLALNESPVADVDIRDAIGDLVDQYEAAVANFGNVRTRGLAVAPDYDPAYAQTVYDRAWNACELGS